MRLLPSGNGGKYLVKRENVTKFPCLVRNLEEENKYDLLALTQMVLGAKNSVCQKNSFLKSHQMTWPLWKNSLADLRKLHIESSCDPSILILGRHPKELKAGSKTDTYTLTFITPLFAIVRMWKRPKCHQQMNRPTSWHRHTKNIIFF